MKRFDALNWRICVRDDINNNIFLFPLKNLKVYQRGQHPPLNLILNHFT